jgi:hypothetical protein
MTQTAWQALRFGSPKLIRLMLAVCSTAAGISFIFIPAGAEYMVRYPHLFLIFSPSTWGALFCFTALAMFWRIFDYRSRIGLSRIINGAMFCLWMCFASANFWAVGFFTPDMAALFGMAIAAAWATLRTDLTNSDRADA